MFQAVFTFFSPYLGIGRTEGGVGGVSQGIGTQPADVVLYPGQLKNRSCRNLSF